MWLIKEKGKHGTYNVKNMLESIMHGTWKEYENDSMSLLMAKYTDVRSSTTRLHLYIIALLRFDIVKK